MGKRTLSLYIDESKALDKENPTSRFYLISLVAHNADDDVAGKVKDFKRGLDSIGIANACFHAGPIIYGNDQFRVLNWDLRRRGSTYSCKWLTSLPRCASSSLRCGLGCR